MTAVALNQDESVTVLLRDLAASLEDRDPEAREIAQADWAKCVKVGEEGGRKPTEVDQVFIVAHAHQSRCRKGKDDQCICCTLAKAILFGCVFADEKQVRDLVEAMGTASRKLQAIERNLTAAVEKFQQAEAPIIEMWGRYVLASELPRRTVPPKVLLDLRALIASLREGPRALLPESVYDGILPSLDAKPGGRPQAFVDFAVAYLRAETGLSDENIGELMGMGKYSIRQRRRKGRAA